MDHGVNPDRVSWLRREEEARFTESHPRSLELLVRARQSMPLGVPMSWMAFLYDHPPLFVDFAEGAHFTDVDGNRYLDMMLAISAASTGHTPLPIVQAVTERVARGVQFCLPTEDAIAVSEELGRRWGLPKWQYQLTSTQAVTEAIHLARIATRGERILVFEGKYHGNVVELLAVAGDDGTAPEYVGIAPRDIERTTVVDWNDLGAVARELEAGDVALLIVEPILTNSGLVFPEDGFHSELRRLTHAHGALLAVDETQTLPMAFGGLTREWGLEPDFVILGKSVGGGIPAAALGMTDGSRR